MPFNLKMKKILISLLIILTIFIYRNEIYNLLFKYQELEIISTQKLNSSYHIGEINNILNSKDWSGIVALNNLLLKYTKRTLSYGTKQTTNNINKFKKGTKAHCVGYAAFHNAVLNYTLNLLNIKNYRVYHIRGEIEFLGINLNKLSNSSFFKTHDFVKIVNMKNGKYYYCDPSLFEFSKINKIGSTTGI